MIAAKAAGCDVVGLTYGYNYNIPIEQSNPTFVTSEFKDVLKIVGE